MSRVSKETKLAKPCDVASTTDTPTRLSPCPSLSDTHARTHTHAYSLPLSPPSTLTLAEDDNCRDSCVRVCLAWQFVAKFRPLFRVERRRSPRKDRVRRTGLGVESPWLARWLAISPPAASRLARLTAADTLSRLARLVEPPDMVRYAWLSQLSRRRPSWLGTSAARKGTAEGRASSVLDEACPSSCVPLMVRYLKPCSANDSSSWHDGRDDDGRDESSASPASSCRDLS